MKNSNEERDPLWVRHYSRNELFQVIREALIEIQKRQEDELETAWSYADDRLE